MDPISRSRRTILIAGAAMLIGSLVPARSIAGDFRYEPGSGENWPQNVVREVQRRLQADGYDPGPIDGVYGPKTARAIANFQASHGAPPDGKISDELLDALGVN